LNSSLTVAAPTWTFSRGGDRMHIVRVATTRLLVSSTFEGAREMDFETAEELLEFQVRYERELIADGWLLIEFSPERRAVRDRRQLRRFGAERRERPSPPVLPPVPKRR
jgi:hypothetical protein